MIQNFMQSAKIPRDSASDMRDSMLRRYDDRIFPRRGIRVGNDTTKAAELSDDPSHLDTSAICFEMTPAKWSLSELTRLVTDPRALVHFLEDKANDFFRCETHGQRVFKPLVCASGLHKSVRVLVQQSDAFQFISCLYASRKMPLTTSKKLQ
jgi:hypothetical protein